MKGGKINGIAQNPKGKALDFSDRIAVPGFIDIHTHGIHGIDSYTADPGDYVEWRDKVIETGTTAFIPTLVSSSLDTTEHFLTSVENGAMIDRELAADIIGARMEGPFINPEKKGAHDPQFLRHAGDESTMAVILRHKSILRIIDIAPELDGALRAINRLVKEGIIVSMGHTLSDEDTAARAYAAGANLITHFHNAMPEFNHRKPSVLDFGYIQKDIFIELICDLVHTSSSAIRIATRQKDRGTIILITDSISATMKGDGKYSLGELPVLVRGGKCTIEGTDTIAGSILTLDAALRNLISLGYRLEDIGQYLSTNQSRLLKIGDRGLIRKDFRADIAILDKAFKVKGIIKNGKLKEF